MMRVCFFGAYDRGYPRNRILREGLALAGIAVREACVPEERAFRRYPALLAAFAPHLGSIDVLLVPEFRHKDVPLARGLAPRGGLVFDPLVSRHDTLVEDWGLHAPGSSQARWNLGIDRWALGAADLVLGDTFEHGELFASLGARRSRIRRVPVGAEAPFFALADPFWSDPVEILYAGGFLPLHGVPVIVEALARLERDSADLPPWRATLVGKGIDFEVSRALAAAAGLRRVEFVGPRPYAELPASLARAHIVLGAFGVTPKAARVIPHKVWQGLASGRAVVTADTRAARELLDPGIHFEGCARGDAVSLAEALRALIASPARRACVGAAGRARAREIATPAAIGRALKAALAGGGDALP